MEKIPQDTKMFKSGMSNQWTGGWNQLTQVFNLAQQEGRSTLPTHPCCLKLKLLLSIEIRRQGCLFVHSTEYEAASESG